MDALDHGFGEGQPCAFAFADQLPLFGGVEQIEGLLVVVEFGLAGGHVAEDVVDDGDALEPVLVVHGGLALQVFVLLQRLPVVALLHPLDSDVVFSLEPLLRELLLQSTHYRRLLQHLDDLALLLVAFTHVQFQQVQLRHDSEVLVCH